MQNSNFPDQIKIIQELRRIADSADPELALSDVSGAINGVDLSFENGMNGNLLVILRNAVELMERDLNFHYRVGVATSKFAFLEHLLSQSFALLAFQIHHSDQARTIFYAIDSFNGRKKLVQDLVKLRSKEFPLVKSCWEKIKGRFDSLQELRNQIAHGAIWNGNDGPVIHGGRIGIEALEKKTDSISLVQLDEFIEKTAKLQSALSSWNSVICKIIGAPIYFQPDNKSVEDLIVEMNGFLAN